MPTNFLLYLIRYVCSLNKTLNSALCPAWDISDFKKFFLDHPKFKAGPKITCSMSPHACMRAAKPLSLLPLQIIDLPLNPGKNLFGCLSRFYSFPSTPSQVMVPTLHYVKRATSPGVLVKEPTWLSSVAPDLVLETCGQQAWHLCLSVSSSLPPSSLSLPCWLPVGSAGGAAPTAVFLCPAQPPWGLRMLQPGARHGGKR